MTLEILIHLQCIMADLMETLRAGADDGRGGFMTETFEDIVEQGDPVGIDPADQPRDQRRGFAPFPDRHI